MNVKSKVKEQLANLPTFSTKEEALQEAVDQCQKNKPSLLMVAQREDGKFIVCTNKNIHIDFAFLFCEIVPVYGDQYIHSLAMDEHPTEADRVNELKRVMGLAWIEKHSKWAEENGIHVTKFALCDTTPNKCAEKPELSPADCDRWDTPPGATYTISNPQHDETRDCEDAACEEKEECRLTPADYDRWETPPGVITVITDDE